MKKIRSKIESNFCAILNILYAIHIAEELSRRNEVLKFEAIKRKVITKNSKPQVMESKPSKMKVCEPDSELSDSLEVTSSNISKLSPRIKKPKLDQDSGNESTSLTDSESRKKIKPITSNTLILALQSNMRQEFGQNNSHKLVAPPSTPITTPSTPRFGKCQAFDMNIYSISGGIFEERKSFFENNNYLNSEQIEKNYKNKKCVVIVEGNGTIKRLQKV